MRIGRLAGKWCCAVVVISFVLLFPLSIVLAQPSISLTNVCPYGKEDCTVSGKVSGVNYSDYCVAVYIQVDEVWWTKPTYASPCCPIAPDGTFTCDITTGGCDRYATAVKAILMPKGKTPSICGPCQCAPKNPDSVASITKARPYPRTLAFSGYNWRVKQAPDCALGPGKNFFSDLPRDVWVDDAGLHMRIRKGTDRWFSTEVIMQHSLGYGTYIFHTNSRVDTLDPNMVLGLFTWDGKKCHASHREMDIEFARWGDPNMPTNAQFVVQPCSQCPGCANCSRFQVDLTDKSKYLTTYMIWTPGSVIFRTYKGQYWNDPPAGSLVHEWEQTGAGVPTEGAENIRINFWLLGGNPPLNGKNADVIIENFIFQPLCP